jgi:hypothetical protein
MAPAPITDNTLFYGDDLQGVPQRREELFRFKPLFATSLLAVMSAVGLAACGGGAPPALAPTSTLSSLPSTETPAPPIATSIATQQPATGETSGTINPLAGPVADVLVRAATSMKNVKSYHGTFTSQVAGNTVVSVFDFQAPDKMHMNYNLPEGNVDIIIVGNDAYARAPGANGYVAIPSGGYNVGGVTPAQFVILLNSAQGGQVVGDEEMQGVKTTHLKFTYDTNKVVGEMAQQTGQPTPAPLVSPGATTVDAWVEKSTGYIVQYKSSVNMGAGMLASTVVLSRFNEPVNPPIVSPAVSP